MSNLAVEKQPITWDDYFFNAHHVRDLRGFIEKGKHPYAITMSGATGTGKTTLASLYMRATFCERRQPGTSTMCGQCKACKLDPRTATIESNILYLQDGKEDSLTDQFKFLLSELYKVPYGGFARDDQRYKFVVIDELQNVSKDRLTKLLFFTEVKSLVEKSGVIFLFLTMAPDEINQTVFLPLVDRSFPMEFYPFSEAQVGQYLSSHYPNLHPDSLRILVTYAKGSIRRALSGLDICQSADPFLAPDSVAERLNYLSTQTRIKIWEALVSRDYAFLHSFWQTNANRINPTRMIAQFIEDLDLAMISSSNATHLQAYKILCSYSPSSPIPAWNLLRMLVGLELRDVIQVLSRRSPVLNGAEMTLPKQDD